MKEKHLQETTRQLLQYLKNRGAVRVFYHPFNSQKSQMGFPDWCIVMTRLEDVTWRRRHVSPAEKVGSPSAKLASLPLQVIDQFSASELLFVELKSEGGTLSPNQEDWRAALGQRYHMVRSMEEFIDALGVRDYFYDLDAPIDRVRELQRQARATEREELRNNRKRLRKLDKTVGGR